MDESTKATAYKWYKEGAKRVSGYSATAPSGYPDATKTKDSKWTEFTSWSAKKPASARYNDKGYKVEKLEDIMSNGELKYKVKMLIRNKKEAK